MTVANLFMEFFKIGLFAVGGGLATIPFLQALIEKYGFVTSGQLLDMIAISESTPGPIGINCATYMGIKACGIFGGAVATLGLVAPSIITIIIVAKIFVAFSENPYIEPAFSGIRPVVVGLIFAVFVNICSIALFNYEPGYTGFYRIDLPGLFLFLLLFVLMIRFKKHPALYIAVSAVFGIIYNI